MVPVLVQTSFKLFDFKKLVEGEMVEQNGGKYIFSHGSVYCLMAFRI